MTHCSDSAESRAATTAVLDIIDGTPWTARHLRNLILRQHCRLVGRVFRGDHSPSAALRPTCRRLLLALGTQTPVLTTVPVAELPLATVLVRIAAYRQHWLRSPESWQAPAADTPRAWLRSLLEHLFATWPMPACFDAAWWVNGALGCLERDWYCQVAGGGSWRQAPGMPRTITARALHFAWHAPAELTIRQALRWGQVMAAGGSAALAAAVIASRMTADLSNDAVWSRLVAKVAADAAFEPADFGLIADTLVEVIAGEGVPRAETLLDRPLPELLRGCRKYWQTICESLDSELPEFKRPAIECPHFRATVSRLVLARWPGLENAPPFEGRCRDDGRRWCIRELTCYAQLIAESRELKHCVRSYRRRCWLGVSSVFSLQALEIRCGRECLVPYLTIEVDRESRRIVQIRGKWNRRYARDEHPLVRQWAEQLRLVG